MRVAVLIDRMSEFGAYSGCGRSFTAVEWCIAMMCHNVMHCLGVVSDSILVPVVSVWTIAVFSWACLGGNDHRVSGWGHLGVDNSSIPLGSKIDMV